MKSRHIWMQGAGFHPFTHLFQANFQARGERHRAAVSLQPIVWMMEFLKQAALRWGFSYLTNVRSWPTAAIRTIEI